MTLAEKFAELLADNYACEEARCWAAGKTLSEAWSTCVRGDWMVWLMGFTAGDRRTNEAASGIANAAWRARVRNARWETSVYHADLADRLRKRWPRPNWTARVRALLPAKRKPAAKPKRKAKR